MWERGSAQIKNMRMKMTRHVQCEVSAGSNARVDAGCVKKVVAVI